MTTIIPASKVHQGNLVLYTAPVKVKNLIEGFYEIDRLNYKNPKSGGYQRLLEDKRAKEFSGYLLSGLDKGDVLLPTSAFLATDKDIPFDEGNSTITITPDILPFFVVDGQHRLEGLRIAAAKDERILDFQVPVNIAVGLGNLIQMCHFLVVNTTQKKVDKSIEQQIIAWLSEGWDTEDLPTLPSWVSARVEMGSDRRALRIVEHLNESDDSPWKNRVIMANAPNKNGSVTQKMFVIRIVESVLRDVNNPLARPETELLTGKKIFLNYWKAIANILDDGGEPSALYQTSGMTVFCLFSTPLLRENAVRKKTLCGCSDARVVAGVL